MIRAVFFVAALFGIALGAAWFADHPGGVAVDWGGWRIETSVSVAALGVAAVVAVISLIYRFWLWLGRGPAALAESRVRSREQKGYAALTQGLVAVAAGDAATARRLARQAEVMLEEPPLTQLLSAQAAQLDGDEAAAARYFGDMLERPETEFLALRGLLNQAMRAGDAAKALEYAGRAHQAKPEAVWASDALFSLQAKAGKWRDAQTTLESAGRRKGADGTAGKRKTAIALFSQAREQENKGAAKKAQKLAEKAHAAAEDFVPAAVACARLLTKAGKSQRAADIIATCWRLNPHPDLAEAFNSAWAEENAERRAKRFETLVGGDPSHREARIALGQLMVEARQFEAAREQLGPLLSEAEAEAGSGRRPGRRLCKLMAALEEAQSGQAAAARPWLVKLADAPADAAWICSSCGHAQNDWAAHCPACGRFDAQTWRRPGVTVDAPAPGE